MSKLKVTPERHKSAIDQLKARRKNEPWQEDNRKLDNAIRDYTTHLNKCGYGASIMDVGCGRQYLKRCIPEDVLYLGIDAFPAEGYEDVTTAIAIEEEFAKMYEAETVVAFAVLDNCRDFDLAIANMQEIAQRNIIILTGIGIDPDKYHTMRLEFSDFDSRFAGWENTIREEVSPKVWLLNFMKP